MFELQLNCQCLTFTRQITMYLQTWIQRALCINQAETMPQTIRLHPRRRSWTSASEQQNLMSCCFTSPAALASDSTACLMTKASTGLTMIWNLPVICSLTAKFSRASQAYRPCLPASRQCQQQGRLICPNVTWEVSSGRAEGGCFLRLTLCLYLNRLKTKLVHPLIQHFGPEQKS